MTHEKAEQEFWQISRRTYMWPTLNPSPMTPYQHAVLRRQSDLFGFLYGGKAAPADGWTAPRCDVEETVENWYRNHFPENWRERMAANHDRLPPLPNA